MEKFVIDNVKLSYKLQEYYQNKYPSDKVSYYCWPTEIEGRIDWDGFVDVYYKMCGVLYITKKVNLFGEEQEITEETRLDQKRIFNDIKEMIDEYLKEEKTNLTVLSINPSKKNTTIKLKEKNKILIKK